MKRFVSGMILAIGVTIGVGIAMPMGYARPEVISAQTPAPTIQLTADQKATIAAIRQSMQPQIRGILAAEQRQSYQKMRQRGISPQQALSMLVLSREQQQSLRAVLNQGRRSIGEVMAR
jgi:uncharacterized membrane protein